MNKYIIGLLFLSLLAIGILSMALKLSNSEKERMEINQRILLQDSIQRYKAKNNLLVSSIQQLELTLSEIKESRAKIVKELHNMKIRSRDAIAVGKTTTVTAVSIKVPIRDEIHIDSGRVVKVKKFQWSDTWTSINGEIEEDSVKLNYNSLDTLVQVIHVEKHKFLFIRWGVKAIRQSVTLKNPNSRIVSTEYIKIR